MATIRPAANECDDRNRGNSGRDSSPHPDSEIALCYALKHLSLFAKEQARGHSERKSTRMLRVVEVIPVRGRNPKLETRNKSSHNAVCDRAQDGEQYVFSTRRQAILPKESLVPSSTVTLFNYCPERSSARTASAMSRLRRARPRLWAEASES